ncbi:helix-turn-helix domain-containing protein [Parasedimentitalea maritima]|uniref:Cupin domain-containing protein n=1 Tax=Parasedimentitalea maritima TaxID=2578117 RepID=A0A5R8ZQX6_9RHOB|nr:XRE family transcriptional regulator [Zongyanglinia marina]KAE9630054.1 cupin domain-containing protein [Zongyanglinia marina]TLP67993.1 helix-turn-helix domain-containing protein [Zongyanglinia marina]
MDGPNKRRKRTAGPEPTQLGNAIRYRRKALKKTLEDVANEAGLTTGFISQVERGISSPSLSSFMSIASCLQTNIEQLLSVPEELSEYTPKDKRQTYSLGTAGRLYEKLGPGFAGSLLYSSIIHRPPGHISEKMQHDGEVFCYLLSGQLEYHLGDEIFVVSPGDTIHHDTSKPHFSKVLSDTEAVELWVCTSPMSDANSKI